MLGAVAGDIIGSAFEAKPIKTTEFPLFSESSRFTDDSVLSIAVADSILNRADLIDTLKDYYRRYPTVGYGSRFEAWAQSDRRDPYQSFGNGSAMRASAVGFAYNSMREILAQAKKSAEVTHDHPEGIKGAQATAAAVFLARATRSKDDIRYFSEHHFEYRLNQPLNTIRQNYEPNATCPGTVPHAISAFLESDDFESAIRNAVSLGGDSDTLACIAGGIAHAYYSEVPEPIKEKVFEILDPHLKQVLFKFCVTCQCI